MSLRKKLFYSILAALLMLLALTAALTAVVFCCARHAGSALGATVAVLMLLAVAVALVLAVRLTRSIVAPLNRLRLSDPQDDAVYTELQPLVKRIDAQNRQIAETLAEITATHERQDTLRRDFTANVSHELKTPLTSISGYAELLKNGMVQPADVQRFSGKIYEESQRLITLVGDILKLSRLDSRELTVEMEDVDLYALCAGVLSHLEMAAAQRGVKMALSGKRLHIRAVEQLVEEIVYNLCDNAIKYNRVNGTVEVSLRQCVDGVELTVRDTGIGIADADKAHVFERFYRADKSRSQAVGGTGLGLSIVKHSAQYLGAAVSLESTPDVGTTVRVLF